MLKHLKFSVTFPTGKTIEGDHAFNLGLTSIRGANERGKSLRMEFIRFALFGSKALRGKATDYKKLDVELSFTLKGVDYEIVRGGSKVLLSAGGAPLASGTTPVNQKVIDLFGYDLTVFDMANACLQGQAEALGNMPPAERRRMVEQTVGLTMLDKLADIISSREGETKAQLGTLRPLLVEPVEPEPPVGLADFNDALLADSEAMCRRASGVEGQIKQLSTIPAPIKPQPVNPDLPSMEELRKHQQDRAKKRLDIAIVEGEVNALPECLVGYHELEALKNHWKAYQSWLDYSSHARRYPVPTYSAAQLDAAENYLTQHAAFRQVEALLSEAAALEAKDKIECPECHHHFLPKRDHQKLEAVRLQIERFHGNVDEYSSTPTLTSMDITREREYLKNYQVNPYSETAEVPHPTVGEAEIAHLSMALENKTRRQQLVEELDRGKATLPPDRSSDIEVLTEYEKAMSEFKHMTSIYTEAQHTLAGLKLELEAMVGCFSKRDSLLDLKTRVTTYQQQLVSYECNLKWYRDRLDQVNALDKLLDQYGKAKKALKDLKIKVKSYLVPSLSRVASQLVSQMTGGVRNDILVTEDFEIIVDGQRLDTLSGSGKAVANLAVRIGLGQVLTNKTFSVFLADEIDAAMDTERGQHTIECLSNLSGSIKQIVLISHKNIPTTHTIEV